MVTVLVVTVSPVTRVNMVLTTDGRLHVVDIPYKSGRVHCHNRRERKERLIGMSPRSIIPEGVAAKVVWAERHR